MIDRHTSRTPGTSSVPDRNEINRRYNARYGITDDRVNTASQRRAASYSEPGRPSPFKFFKLLIPAGMLLIIPLLILMSVTHSIGGIIYSVVTYVTLAVILITSALVLIACLLVLPGYLRERRRGRG